MSEPMVHTAGPWQVTEWEDGEVWVQKLEEGELWPIATTEPEHASHEVRQANARLIAAAPAMFEELRLLNAWFRLMVGAAIDSGSEPVGEWLRAFKHQERSTAIAIAKARGQS